jgi:hypothetical protein
VISISKSDETYYSAGIEHQIKTSNNFIVFVFLVNKRQKGEMIQSITTFSRWGLYDVVWLGVTAIKVLYLLNAECRILMVIMIAFMASVMMLSTMSLNFWDLEKHRQRFMSMGKKEFWCLDTVLHSRGRYFALLHHQLAISNRGALTLRLMTLRMTKKCWASEL